MAIELNGNNQIGDDMTNDTLSSLLPLFFVRLSVYLRDCNCALDVGPGSADKVDL